LLSVLWIYKAYIALFKIINERTWLVKLILLWKVDANDASQLFFCKAAHTLKTLVLRLVSCNSYLQLRERSFRSWSESCRMHALNFQQECVVSWKILVMSYESVNWFTTLRIKVVHFCHMSAINYPTTRCNNPEDLLNQQPGGGNLNSLFLCCCKYISLWLFYLLQWLCYVDTWLIFHKQVKW
jgi:hypothetical protein